MDLGSSSLILPEKNCSDQKKIFFHYFFSIKVFFGQKVLRQYKAYSRTKQKGVYLGVQIGSINVKKCNYGKYLRLDGRARSFSFISCYSCDSLGYDIIAPSKTSLKAPSFQKYFLIQCKSHLDAGEHKSRRVKNPWSHGCLLDDRTGSPPRIGQCLN